MRFKLILLLPLCLSFCSSEITIHDGYNFNKPAQITDLPPELLEISGISHVKDQTLVAVQDEQATIYFIDLEQRKIRNTITFGQRGDYEDLVFTGDHTYVLQSNGNIFKILNTGKDEIATEIITGLSRKYDAEGLCHDRENNRLLLACKGSAKGSEGEKLIFAFDLKTERLSDSPVIAFSIQAIEAFVKQHKDELQNSVKGISKEEKINRIFTPSALAIHPISKELYILSSRNNLLLISDLQGKIINMITLSYDLFKQPEGITFSPDGKLYISNEGKKTPANIIGYSYGSK